MVNYNLPKSVYTTNRGPFALLNHYRTTLPKKLVGFTRWVQFFRGIHWIIHEVTASDLGNNIAWLHSNGIFHILYIFSYLIHIIVQNESKALRSVKFVSLVIHFLFLIFFSFLYHPPIHHRIESKGCSSPVYQLCIQLSCKSYLDWERLIMEQRCNYMALVTDIFNPLLPPPLPLLFAFPISIFLPFLLTPSPFHAAHFSLHLLLEGQSSLLSSASPIV